MKYTILLLKKRLRYLFPSRWPSLRARMTISYVSVTVGSVLTFLLLVVLATGALSALVSDPAPSDFFTAMQQQAQSYALLAAVQAQGVTLDPQTNFIPGQTHTLALPNQKNQLSHVSAPYIATGSPDPTTLAIAVLITPSRRVIASSYPSRYSAGMAVSALLPAQMGAIDRALAGQASTGAEHLSSLMLGYVAEPVWSQDHRPMGAIFLQAPVPQRDGILSRLWGAFLSNILVLALVTPVGVFFGWITTRSLVRRVRQLVLVTKRFADGEYAQRVNATDQDEIGQLERQFNQMAEQLVDHIAHRQQLAEQNARLEERSRISRELHDAVSQDLFSLRMLSNGLQEAAQAGSSPADLRPHIALLEQATGDMVREMRALLLELRPTQLQELGLVGALQALAYAYSMRLGIAVTADLKPVALDAKAEHALLRIAQESLANAARHSNATLIALCLASEGERVKLTITDNGVGFAMNDAVARHGLGLRIMQERAAELHGAFDLKSAPGQGTRISVDVLQEHAYD